MAGEFEPAGEVSPYLRLGNFLNFPLERKLSWTGGNKFSFPPRGGEKLGIFCPSLGRYLMELQKSCNRARAWIVVVIEREPG